MKPTLTVDQVKPTLTVDQVKPTLTVDQVKPKLEMVTDETQVYYTQGQGLPIGLLLTLTYPIRT